jgi:hypothetical protein
MGINDSLEINLIIFGPNQHLLLDLIFTGFVAFARLSRFA